MTGKDISIRQELAALYRLLDIYKMSDLANQCAGARSIENKDNYFIHPSTHYFSFKKLYFFQYLPLHNNHYK